MDREAFNARRRHRYATDAEYRKRRLMEDKRNAHPSVDPVAELAKLVREQSTDMTDRLKHWPRPDGRQRALSLDYFPSDWEAGDAWADPTFDAVCERVA